MITTVRAKLRAGYIKKDEYGTAVDMNAVYSDDPDSENKAFSDATPSARFNMHISPGKAAGDFFEQGAEYYVDISRVVPV